ncbi:MAG: diaminopimelate decarboxylase [Gemmatimonadetes bacterium]|nr:diaminopimelate decarboxylase [Gemmatimonadota bacterium]
MGQGVLTAGFSRVDNALHCEGVSVERIAGEAGTPLFVYSAATIRDRFTRLDAALEGVPHRLHYTLKANANRAILELVRSMGGGVDVVSGGELYRAQQAGFRGEDIIFGGVGKTAAELRQAVEADVLFINAESEAEVRLLDSIAGELGMRARLSLRVNPEITIESAHEYIKTGEKGHKFGIPYDDVVHVGKVALQCRNLTLVGLDMHLGSQLSRIDPYRAGTQRLVQLHSELVALGARDIRWLDIGGGLGVRYDSEEPPDLGRFGEEVLPLVEGTGLTLVMEPGRFIVGNAGMLVARVLYRKRSGGKDYVIADAGMTELLRPSHYGAYHRIEAVIRSGDTARVDVVGPICESGDFLALDREMDQVGPGDLLAIYDVGAYGAVMSSNYNARPRAAEVMVDGDRWALVTERESLSDLVRHEIATPSWRS